MPVWDFGLSSPQTPTALIRWEYARSVPAPIQWTPRRPDAREDRGGPFLIPATTPGVPRRYAAASDTDPWQSL